MKPTDPYTEEGKEVREGGMEIEKDRQTDSDRQRQRD